MFFRVIYDNSNHISSISDINAAFDYTIDGIQQSFNKKEFEVIREKFCYFENAWYNVQGEKTQIGNKNHYVYIVPVQVGDVLVFTAHDYTASFGLLKSYCPNEDSWNYLTYNGVNRIVVDAGTSLTITVPSYVSYIVICGFVRSDKKDYTPQLSINNKNFDLYDFNYDRHDIRSFGALGDGVTDDYIPLKNAFARGGKIIIPDGTYMISTIIDFYSNTEVFMENNAILKRSANIWALLSAYFAPDTTEYNGVHDFSISGGVLDMNANVNFSGSCIALMHGKNINITNVTFKNVHSKEHFVDMSACENVVFANCIFTNMLTNASSTEQIQLDFATIGSNRAYPYRVYDDNSPCYDDTGCDNIEICGCKFYLNDYSPAVGNHNPGLHKNINIHDNFIFGTGKNVITFNRGAFAFSTHSAFGSLPNQTTRCLIHHNIINNCRYIVMTDANAVGHIYLRDNIFNNCYEIENPSLGTNVELTNNIELNE